MVSRLVWCWGLLALGGGAAADKWDAVREVLADGVALQAFPGAVAMVDDSAGTLFHFAIGNHTYGEPTPLNPGTPSPATTAETLFDMASLTKVVATTTATMLLYQGGLLDLDVKVAAVLGDAFNANGKHLVSVRNLLLHNAGFTPDPVPNFWSPAFGCPATLVGPHPDEVFSCQAKIFSAVLSQKLQYPTGAQYVYSDLSMITMMFVAGTIIKQNELVPESALLPSCVAAAAAEIHRSGGGGSRSSGVGPIAQCYYEAFVRTEVLQVLGMASSGFLPAQERWPECAPAWNDTTGMSPGPAYRHRVVQGRVSDGNSYALGGIAGHAGLFSTAADAMRLARALLFSGATGQPGLVNETTVATFTKVYNISQSARALGWDTNSYAMNEYRGCGNFSEQTFTHTGYTGTQICNDPIHGIASVLLTNRVYPIANDASEVKIHAFRQKFNNAVLEVVMAGRRLDQGSSPV